MTDEKLREAIGLPPDADLLEWARRHLLEIEKNLMSMGDPEVLPDAAALHIALDALEREERPCLKR